MSGQMWRQMFPNPDLSPGFTLDPRGRAHFLVKGYRVEVQVAYLNEDSHEVEITASVTLNSIKVAESSVQADWSEPYTMRDMLDYLLNDVVQDVALTVRKLAERVAEIEAKQS